MFSKPVSLQLLSKGYGLSVRVHVALNTQVRGKKTCALIIGNYLDDIRRSVQICPGRGG